MRQSTYMNVILTVIAVLLSSLLWMQVAAKPLFAQGAEAQSTTRKAQSSPLSNAAADRAKMIAVLERMQKAVTSSQKLLESGKVKVQVSNLSEIKIQPPRN